MADQKADHSAADISYLSRAVRGVDLKTVPPEKLKDLRKKVETYDRAGRAQFGKGLRSLYRDGLRLASSSQFWPRTIVGRVLNPAPAGPASRVLVTLKLSEIPGYYGRDVIDFTNDSGVFSLRLPLNVPVPADGASLTLVAQGESTTTLPAELKSETKALPKSEVSSGTLPDWTLKTALFPLQQSIVSRIRDIVNDLQTSQAALPTLPSEQVSIQLGDDEPLYEYKQASDVDSFPYSVLIRLIEPYLWPLTVDGQQMQLLNKRKPVSGPVDVDTFRSALVGVDSDGAVTSELSSLPLAGTLGLGYVLNLSQTWSLDSLVLGDLLYSLALAPGEKQEIAVVEQTSELSLRDREFSSAAEQQAALMRSDSSTNAVFKAAYDQTVSRESEYRVESDTSSNSAGGGIGIINTGFMFGGGASGSSGSTTTEGSSSGSLFAADNFSKSASERLTRSVQQSASAFRQAQRATIRSVSTSERREGSIRTIENHNRAHVLTVQYFEVLRLYNIRTQARSVSLVCMVPLSIVHFLPAGQRLRLSATDQVIDTATPAEGRKKVLARYEQLIKHHACLQAVLPRRFVKSLNALMNFAANPEVLVATKVDDSVDSLKVQVTAGLLPDEIVSVTIIMRNGRRIGPYTMDNAVAPIDVVDSRADFLAQLKQKREAPAPISRTIGLSPKAGRQDIASFLFTVTQRGLRARINLDKADSNNTSDPVRGLRAPFWDSGIYLSVSAINEAVGRPSFDRVLVTDGAAAQTFCDASPEGGVDARGVLVNSNYIPPEIGYSDILEFETVLQHVLANALAYSKAVWTSLTPEELVVLLEPYSIGLPAPLSGAALPEASDDIPLMNCVGTSILGCYGNSIVLPFQLPESLATALASETDGGDEKPGDAGGVAPAAAPESPPPMRTADLETLLLDFHKSSQSTVTGRIVLPTQGVLGEAALSRSPAAEKIDLRRFWNWKDSPVPEATATNPFGEKFFDRTDPLSADAAKPPAGGAAQPNIINNVGGSGAADSAAQSILDKLITNTDSVRAYPDPGPSKDLFDLGTEAQKTAEAARKDMAAMTKDIVTQVLTALPKLLAAQKDAAAAAAGAAGAGGAGAGAGGAGAGAGAGAGGIVPV